MSRMFPRALSHRLVWNHARPCWNRRSHSPHTSDTVLIVTPPSAVGVGSPPRFLLSKPCNQQHMWTSRWIQILPCMPHLSSSTPNFFPPGAWFSLICFHGNIFSNSPQSPNSRAKPKYNNCGWVLATAVRRTRCRWMGLWWRTSHWKQLALFVMHWGN